MNRVVLLIAALIVMGVGSIAALVLLKPKPPAPPPPAAAIASNMPVSPAATNAALAVATPPPAPPAPLPPTGIDWAQQLPGADIAKGQAVAAAKCGACHDLSPGGADLVGPALFGVVGRAPAESPGYRYSVSMQLFAAQHRTWTYDLLDRYVELPETFIPGTKMTFYGVADRQDRINLIAYLRANGSASYPFSARAPER